jgi:hypothetical protein
MSLQIRKYTKATGKTYGRPKTYLTDDAQRYAKCQSSVRTYYRKKGLTIEQAEINRQRNRQSKIDRKLLNMQFKTACKGFRNLTDTQIKHFTDELNKVSS